MAVFGSKPVLFLLAACRPPQRMWADIPVECVDPGVVVRPDERSDVVATDGPPWTWVVTGNLPAELAPGGRAWFPEAPPAAWAQLALSVSHTQGTREPDGER